VQGITDLITSRADQPRLRGRADDHAEAGSALMGIGGTRSTVQSRPPARSRHRSSRRRSTVRRGSCSTSRVAPTSGSPRSTRPHTSSRAQRTRTRTSSSAP
jgi:hypothetical protein